MPYVMLNKNLVFRDQIIHLGIPHLKQSIDFFKTDVIYFHVMHFVLL